MRFGGTILFAAVLCLLIVLCLPLPGWTVQTPTETVQGTVNEVLYLLTELKETSRAGQRQWEIEQIVRRAFNYQEMAERALGEVGAQATAVDRRQFIRLFVQVLRDDVVDRLRDYTAAQVAYLAEQPEEPGRVRVLIAPAGLAIDTPRRISGPIVAATSKRVSWRLPWWWSSPVNACRACASSCASSFACARDGEHGLWPRALPRLRSGSPSGWPCLSGCRCGFRTRSRS